MAKRKNKNDDRYTGQMGLFDIFDEPQYDIPEHPSIKDFIVDAPKPAKPVEKDENPLDDQLSSSGKHSDREALIFMSFGSGSSGNCSFIGSLSDGGFLIDAGVDSSLVAESLFRIGMSMDRIRGICLTHDHSDHVRFIYSFVRKYPHLKIYCTPKVLNGILRRHNISRRIKDYHKPIYKEFPFAIDKLANFEITAFEVSHDGTDNCGFFIRSLSGSFALATDLGCITPRVDYYMRKANHVMIESNYDLKMLRDGTYPAYLKARIAADNGHLDNEITAAYLKEILTGRLATIFLCHLSQDNNRPEIAAKAVMESLGTHEEILKGRRPIPRVIVLPRFGSTELFTLRINE